MINSLGHQQLLRFSSFLASTLNVRKQREIIAGRGGFLVFPKTTQREEAVGMFDKIPRMLRGDEVSFLGQTIVAWALLSCARVLKHSKDQYQSPRCWNNLSKSMW